MAFSQRIIRKGMNKAVWSGFFMTFFFTTFTGPFLAGIIILLRLSPFQTGLLNSMLSLFLPAQILGSILQNRFFNRKKFWFFSIALRLVLSGFIAVLFLFHQSFSISKLGIYYIFLFAGMMFLGQLSLSVWFSWMGDLVPTFKSAWFWNRRESLVQIAVLIGAIGSGLIIDSFKSTSFTPYIIIIFIGTLFAFIALITQYRIPDFEPLKDFSQTLNLRNSLTLLFRNHNFKIVTLFFGLFAFFDGLFAPFIFVYLKSTMGLSMTNIQLLVSFSTIVAFISTFAFKILTEKYGVKFVILFNTFLKIIELSFYITLGENSSITHLLPIFFLAGISNVGLMTSQFYMLTNIKTKIPRNLLIGFFFSIVGIVGFLGLLLSGILYDLFEKSHLLKDYGFTALNALVFIALLSKFINIIIFKKFDDVKSTKKTTSRFWIKEFILNNPIRGIVSVYTLSKPKSEQKRISDLTKVKSNLATNEILNNLYSPSTKVREGAIGSIIKSKGTLDHILIKELCKIIEIPELGVRIPAIKALGYLKATQAIPLLTKYLHYGSSDVAQMCVFSLGEIGSRDSLIILKKILKKERYRHLWTQVAEAIGKIGCYREVKIVHHVYYHEIHPVVKKQTLIALINLLTEQSVFQGFESEEKDPGNLIEQKIKNLLKNFIQKKSQFKSNIQSLEENILNSIDENNYNKSLEFLIRPILIDFFPQLAKLQSFSLIFNKIFNSKGCIKFLKFKEKNFLSISGWLLFYLWSDIRYGNSDFDRYHYLSILYILESLYQNKNNKIL